MNEEILKLANEPFKITLDPTMFPKGSVLRTDRHNNKVIVIRTYKWTWWKMLLKTCRIKTQWFIGVKVKSI